MRLYTARKLAERLLAENGLSRWRIEFTTDLEDDTEREESKDGMTTAGFCDSPVWVIVLSRQFVLDHIQAHVKNIILHEIAHALQPERSAPHGKKWREIAKRLGVTGLDEYGRTAK